MNIPGQVLIRTESGDRIPIKATEAQRLFIEAYPRFGTVKRTAEAVGIDPFAAYGWTTNEPLESPFGQAWAIAKEIGTDGLIDGMRDGIDAQPSSMPSQVSRMFLIKAQRPEYRDQLNIKSTSMHVSARIDLNQLDPTERAELLRLTQRRLELLQEGNVADGATPDE